MPDLEVKEELNVPLEELFEQEEGLQEVKETGEASDSWDDELADADDENENKPMKKQDPSPGLPVKSNDPHALRIYYERLFPFRYLFQWLNHAPSPTNAFQHREFAFTLSNDAYLRYQAFPNAEALRKDVLRLMPSRFEIGPVYSASPRDRKTIRKAAFKPLEKELVFDIDLTDYDEIRTCCSDKTICSKCWGFVTSAIQVMDIALRNDFAFRHILWVYSGRRGAHAWVCDKRARLLDDAKRRAIASYLEVVKGGMNAGKKVDLKRPLHPHLTRSFDILKRTFQSHILEGQDPWREDKGYNRLLQLLPDRTLNGALQQKWQTHANRPSLSKWADIDSLARSGISSNLDAKALLASKQDIILEYMYPRLDAEVSKHLNHLLKSPFCVHPGTGRICVPIDPLRADTFDPLGVPTVSQVLKELDESGPATNHGAEDAIKSDAYAQTSLQPYIEYFRKFVDALMKDETKLKREYEGDHLGGPTKLEF